MDHNGTVEDALAREVFEIIEAHKREREERQRLAESEWSGGNLGDYVKLVAKNPRIVETAHQRVHRVVIEELGYRTLRYGDDPRLFRALGRDKDETILVPKVFENFYGIEEALDGIASYLYQGAQGAEASRQKLEFVGPVGGAKSDITEVIKFTLEGEVLFVPEGCPTQDNPLWLLPRHARDADGVLVREKIAKKLEVAIDPRADVCPICSWNLREKYGNDYMKFPIITKTISLRDRVGIASISPVELENADISVLIGTIKIRMVHQYDESHPAAVDLTGVYHFSNGGVLEEIEWADFPRDYLNPELTATQEKRIGSPGRQPMCSVDVVIIGHCNVEPHDKFFADPTNAKFKSRTFTVFVPYNVRLDEERQIYEKLTRRSRFADFHIAPHTLHCASRFAISTRLQDSKECGDLWTKIRVLNGEVVEPRGTKTITAQMLRNEHPWDGMTGTDTRFMAKVLDEAFSHQGRRGIRCITPLHVMKTLTRKLNQDREVTRDQDKMVRYQGIIDEVLQDFRMKAWQDAVIAFVTVKNEEAEGEFQKYLDEVEKFVRRELKHEEGVFYNSATLRAIEELVGISQGEAGSFRQELYNQLQEWRNQKVEFHWDHYKPIRDAILKLLQDRLLKWLRIIKYERARDSVQEELYEKMRSALFEIGYQDCCAGKFLDFLADAYVSA